VPIPDQLRSHVDSDGIVSRLPVKLAKKSQLAAGLLEDLEIGKIYTEKEVNEIFSQFVVDFALIRRMLVNSGLLVRDPYGKQYVRPSRQI
jgi:hypothetical protein